MAPPIKGLGPISTSRIDDWDTGRQRSARSWGDIVKRRIIIGVVMALACGRSAGAAPLEAYGKLPFVDMIALAPDGKQLAYAATDGEKRQIVIRNLETGKVVGGVYAGERKIRAIQWAGSGHLVITGSVTSAIPFVTAPRSERFVALDYDIAGKKLTELLTNIADPNKPQTLDVIYGGPDVRFIGGHPFVFLQGAVFVDDRSRLGLFRVDLDQNDATNIVFEGFADTDGYVVDAKGRPLAETEYDGSKGRWLMKVWKGHWTEITRETAPIERPFLLGLGRDGASIAASFFRDEHSVIRELSPDSVTWSAPVQEPDALIWDPATSRLMGEYNLLGDDLVYTFYDPRDQASWNAVLRAYKGSRVILNSFSDDHRKFVVLVDSPTEGPAYALVDLDTRHGEWLSDEYKGLTAADIAEKRAITFKAKDGLELHGYLTLPHGRPAKGLPLVVFPHGGPESRDEPGFDWWAQAMASRGYAVLQVNFRGSAGYGWTFLQAGFGEYGRKMQTDLSDGVRWLAGQGVIDPARVCIVGASYGGYAALAGATLDAGVYRCAASVSGISDPRRLIAWDKERAGDDGAAGERYELRYMGPQARLAEISPLFHIDAVTIPILLVHGKDDTRVPFEQSQIMADALAKAGKTVRFVTLPKEDHFLSQGATRLKMLQSVMDFLETYNPPG
jgi:dipeptidyl aminopeptidase/acylaminoacyl peptidase